MVVPVPGAVPVCVTTRALLLRTRSHSLTLHFLSVTARLSVNQTPRTKIQIATSCEKKIRENTVTTAGKANNSPSQLLKF